MVQDAPPQYGGKSLRVDGAPYGIQGTVLIALTDDGKFKTAYVPQ